MRGAVARCRWNNTTKLWTLYWQRRDLKFHIWPHLDPQPTITPLLAEIDDDSNGANQHDHWCEWAAPSGIEEQRDWLHTYKTDNRVWKTIDRARNAAGLPRFSSYDTATL
jgi:hypothetical protein